MPLSEHTGSHSSAEHEQSLLHSEKSISLSDDALCVLQGYRGFALCTKLQVIVFSGCEKSLSGRCVKRNTLSTDPLYETVSPAMGMLSHLVPNCSSRRRYAMKDVAKES